MAGRSIAIAGCGIAGLSAALLLHRDGHDVRLFERFESARPVGSGLLIQPTGQAVIRAMGLDGPLLAHGTPVDRLLGKAGGRTVLDVSYASLAGSRVGIGIHRAALFHLLHEAVVAAGIPVFTGHAIAGSSPAGHQRILQFAGGTAAGPFDLVVDALGTHSPLAPPVGRELAYGALWASLDWPDAGPFSPSTLEQRYHAASRMAGILPIGLVPGDPRPKLALFWSLRTDRLEDWRRAGLGAWKRQVAELWPETAPLLEAVRSPDQLNFARYAHRTLPRPCQPALIHVGDSWHSASPQLGQGANMALLDSLALSLALGSEADVAPALRHAVSLRRRHVRLYQWLTALLTPVYQSDSRVIPLLRDRLMGPVSRLSLANRFQAAAVSGLLGNPLPILRLDR